MKTIDTYIIEKLTLNKQTKIVEPSFTDEELREDYQTVRYRVFKKSEKEVYANKYNCKSLKIRDIQLVILDYLRKNRHNKSEFIEDDVHDFERFEIPDGNYNKYVKYLEQEPENFIRYMLQFYKNKMSQIHRRTRLTGYGYSISDQRIIRIYDFLKK